MHKKLTIRCGLLAIIAGLTLLCSLSAQACKMTAMGGSTAVITAILKYLAAEPGLQDRDILAIKHLSSGWSYVVETTTGGEGCQALGVEAVIAPSCQITVQPLAEKFLCTSPGSAGGSPAKS